MSREFMAGEEGPELTEVTQKKDRKGERGAVKAKHLLATSVVLGGVAAGGAAAYIATSPEYQALEAQKAAHTQPANPNQAGQQIEQRASNGSWGQSGSGEAKPPQKPPEVGDDVWNTLNDEQRQILVQRTNEIKRNSGVPNVQPSPTVKPPEIIKPAEVGDDVWEKLTPEQKKTLSDRTKDIRGDNRINEVIKAAQDLQDAGKDTQVLIDLQTATPAPAATPGPGQGPTLPSGDDIAKVPQEISNFFSHVWEHKWWYLGGGLLAIGIFNRLLLTPIRGVGTLLRRAVNALPGRNRDEEAERLRDRDIFSRP